jgi:hypothetical protein
VNGTASDVQVIRPFSEAVEMTKLILFRPFDLKKWLIIGFAAWLSHLGGGFNLNFKSNYNYRSGQRIDLHDIPVLRGISDTFHRIPPSLLVAAIVFLILIVLALIVLLAWLRARGSFIFTDCVVRNRAAIAEPWREFRQLGNSFFVFSLLVGLGFLLLAVILAVPSILLVLRSRHAHVHPGALLLSAIVLWAVVIFVLAIAWALVRHLMIAIMYRRRCLAGEGFRTALGLINAFPGEITIYCLFWIVVGIGSAITACVAVCLTCCIAAIPYVGTVILLPLYVCLRAFGLLFLRQFGPDYDVWATLPAAPAILPPEPPPLPAG